jgi:hypothetical protein
MKTKLLALLALAGTLQANPELANIITQEYGAATAEGILLLQAPATSGEPVQWSAVARDPFRNGDFVRTQITKQGNSWTLKADGAGDDLLRSVPPEAIPFSRVKINSTSARSIAAKAALASNTIFATVEYQLAVSRDNGSPEWGLALLNAEGAEVGFILISAETGAINMQDWAGQAGVASRKGDEVGEKGERAAQGVKDTARRAWEWTDGARRETKSFFKELFRR